MSYNYMASIITLFYGGIKNLKKWVSRRRLEGTFGTVLYQFLETGTSDITFMGRVQELK